MLRVEKLSGGWKPASLPSHEQLLAWENKVGMLYNLPTLTTLLMQKNKKEKKKSSQMQHTLILTMIGGIMAPQRHPCLNSENQQILLYSKRDLWR